MHHAKSGRETAQPVGAAPALARRHLGLRLIKNLSSRPFGMNALIERSSQRYHEKMVEWVEVALEEGVRFFITSLGNPRWVCDRAHAAGGVVYHDVTERKWALKGRDAGVDGLIGVNARAGGHPGPRSAEALLQEVGDLGLPVVCAGGIGDAEGFLGALRLGYAGVQMGTRFIATVECGASAAYQQAILDAGEEDIVLSEGSPDQAMDADLVRAQIPPAAQTCVARLRSRQRLLAGGEERCEHCPNRIGGHDRSTLPRPIGSGLTYISSCVPNEQ